jgi:hypothetical protein
MAGYLENLPPHTRVGSVFSEIHRRVDWMVGTIDGINNGRHNHIIGTGEHPAEAMTVSEHSLGRAGHNPGTAVRRRELAVGVDDEQFRLLGVASMVDHSRSYLALEDRTYPVDVMAYRADEHPRGDYSIHQRGFQGEIVVELGKAGLGEDKRTGEPFGVEWDIPPREIGDLSDQSRERLAIITDEILKRLAVARLVMLGGDARDALLILGRDVDFVDHNPYGLLFDSSDTVASS